MAKKIGQQIKELHAHFRNLIEQVDEIEKQINHPDRPAHERRFLRKQWNEAKRGTWFDTTSAVPKKTRPKSSQSILSSALHLKEQAKLFEKAGRLSDAKRISAEAAQLEAKGRSLRKAGY